MHWVDFIRTEQGDDLIVSFVVVASGYPADIVSLNMLRTPKCDVILDPAERGINVSWEKDENELLLRVERSGDVVKLNTTTREFIMDVSYVDDSDLSLMGTVLHGMNFGMAIQLTGNLT